uniref:Putative ovule protein n=1 Tax=Solanum chacoense TaxID=4108 RepID=A0A0V0GK78_SOLCH
MSSSLLYLLLLWNAVLKPMVYTLSESLSLPSQSRGKICVNTTLRKAHLWNYTGYVVEIHKAPVIRIHF